MKKIITLLLGVLPILVFSLSYGHSGRTNANGCHAGSTLHHCHDGSPKSYTSPNERVCVYTFTRANKSYAYIGISNNPPRRWSEHRKDGREFIVFTPQIHSCYTTKKEALSIERAMIKEYCIQHNLHNITYCQKGG